MDRGAAEAAGHGDDHGHGHGHEHGPHHHAHDESCGCGHAHTPDLEASAKASLPEALALIAGVALRPCTGAVFLMLLTWMIGAAWVGVLATYAMGLGTALITLAVALTSSSLRGGLGDVGARHAGTIRVVGHAAELSLGVLVIALVI
jgi:ABC-type nickel/cobalt efflux system permease component RcnA